MTNNSSVILIVDDDAVAARGLGDTIRGLGYGSVRVASDRSDAIQQGRLADIALIRLDSGPKCSGFEVADVLSREPRLSLVYVLGKIDDETLHRARELEPGGYLLCPWTAESVRAAIELARPLPRSSVPPPMPSTSPSELPEMGNGTLTALSPREREIFSALAGGARPPAIARELFISVHTVRRHVQAIFRKLDVHSHVELVHRFGNVHLAIPSHGHNGSGLHAHA